MRTFVMGDIHGSYKALVQCLERSRFNMEQDILVQLGDIADGWSEVYECVDLLLDIKNLIAIKGNHDEWFNIYLKTGVHPMNGMQGSRSSIKSYEIDNRITNEEHHKFFRTQHKYYIDDKNRLFVHGGFNRHQLIDQQSHDYIYWWDRDLWYGALSFKASSKGQSGIYKTKDNFSEIFIGHTTTMNWDNDQPMQAGQIWNLDTGAGFCGKLTIMDVDTKKYWQSDPVQELYSNEQGRNE